MRTYRIRSDIFICMVISGILCAIAYLCIVVLPVKLHKEKKEVETQAVVFDAGEVGCKYKHGVPVLEKIDDILNSDDKFALNIDAIDLATSRMKEDSEGYKWSVAKVEGYTIPVRYNTYAETEHYSPVGILVKEPCNGLEQVHNYVTQGGDKIIEDAYIDMDHGMKEAMYHAEHDKKPEKKKDTSNKIDEKFSDSVIGILGIIFFILTFVLHAIGVKKELLPPLFPKRQQYK